MMMDTQQYKLEICDGLNMKDILMHFDMGQCCNTADTIGQLQAPFNDAVPTFGYDNI